MWTFDQPHLLGPEQPRVHERDCVRQIRHEIHMRKNIAGKVDTRGNFLKAQASVLNGENSAFGDEQCLALFA